MLEENITSANIVNAAEQRELCSPLPFVKLADPWVPMVDSIPFAH